MFDDIIEESLKEPGMKDVGLGEAVGKDPIARKNIVALDERMKLFHQELSDMVMEVRRIDAENK